MRFKKWLNVCEVLTKSIVLYSISNQFPLFNIIEISFFLLERRMIWTWNWKTFTIQRRNILDLWTWNLFMELEQSRKYRSEIFVQFVWALYVLILQRVYAFYLPPKACLILECAFEILRYTYYFLEFIRYLNPFTCIS